MIDKLFLTPEISIQIQRTLNSDVIMVLDECSPYEFDRLENPNTLFGIVQGGMFTSQRKESLEGLKEIGLHGYTIGELSMGEPKEEMQRILDDIA